MIVVLFERSSIALPHDVRELLGAWALTCLRRRPSKSCNGIIHAGQIDEIAPASIGCHARFHIAPPAGLPSIIFSSAPASRANDCGRGMFPALSEAVARPIPLDALRWIDSGTSRPTNAR
jgi:hypothetical protein